jgi:hypothetical protein
MASSKSTVRNATGPSARSPKSSDDMEYVDWSKRVSTWENVHAAKQRRVSDLSAISTAIKNMAPSVANMKDGSINKVRCDSVLKKLPIIEAHITAIQMEATRTQTIIDGLKGDSIAPKDAKLQDNLVLTFLQFMHHIHPDTTIKVGEFWDQFFGTCVNKDVSTEDKVDAPVSKEPTPITEKLKDEKRRHKKRRQNADKVEVQKVRTQRSMILNSPTNHLQVHKDTSPEKPSVATKPTSLTERHSITASTHDGRRRLQDAHNRPSINGSRSKQARPDSRKDTTTTPSAPPPKHTTKSGVDSQAPVKPEAPKKIDYYSLPAFYKSASGVKPKIRTRTVSKPAVQQITKADVSTEESSEDDLTKKQDVVFSTGGSRPRSHPHSYSTEAQAGAKRKRLPDDNGPAPSKKIRSFAVPRVNKH